MECRHIDGDRGNADCSNLRWGTPAENGADNVRNGISAVGEKNPQAKLTKALVADMRAYRAATGESYRLIGNRYGVTTMTAYRACTHQSWECANS
jgi:DNA invertase Pin-like site-specific DNA recombinase